jgi:hypothetical protein
MPYAGQQHAKVRTYRINGKRGLIPTHKFAATLSLPMEGSTNVHLSLHACFGESHHNLETLKHMHGGTLKRTQAAHPCIV